MMSKIKTILQKKALHDAGLVYVGALLNGISLFLINILLGRILDKSLFGVFTLSVLVLSTVAEMSDFGLNAALLRFAPYYLANKETNKLKQLVKTIWKWRVWLSLILTIGGIIISPVLAQYVFNRPELTSYLIVAFLGIGGVVFIGFTGTYLQASQKFFFNSLIQSLKGLLRLFLVIILYFSGARDIYFYLFVYIFIPWLLFLFSYKYLPEGFAKVSIDEDVKKQLHSQVANFSFWLTIWSLSAILASRIDQVMLSNFLGLEQVAIYAVAFQFIYIFSLAIQSITAVLVPKINALKNNEELRDFVKRSFKWLLPASFLIGILIYPSKFLIDLIFGEKYTESLPVYLVLAYSMLFNFIVIPFSLIITAFNKTQLIAFSGFAQLIINLGLNFLLIPKFGVMGAAYTFALGIIFSFIYNALSSIYLLRNKQISIA